MQYSMVDDAAFAVPSGAKAHYVLTITNAAGGLTLGTATDITSGGAVGIPSVTDVNGTRYPKAVCLCCMDTAADVWVTVDGQTPVVGTTQPVGVKLPPTFPTLRLPFPAGIKADSIKLKASTASTPVLVYYEW